MQILHHYRLGTERLRVNKRSNWRSHHAIDLPGERQVRQDLMSQVPQRSHRGTDEASLGADDGLQHSLRLRVGGEQRLPAHAAGEEHLVGSRGLVELLSRTSLHLLRYLAVLTPHKVLSEDDARVVP